MYRFALIGQTSSGKTCYMATLTLNVTHTSELTAQLKQDLTPETDADSVKEANFSDKSINSFVDDRVAERNGNAWITKARTALERGELPGTTDPDRYLVDFRIGSEDRGITEIRMVDYAGEFINQDRDPNEDRTALFRHLQQCDGLLIVAEVIPGDDDVKERRIVNERIGKVADFFGSLHESCKGHLGTAIAVVLTKWDRYSDIDFTNPCNENGKVVKFLSESPSHRNLINRVKIILSEQADIPADLPIGVQFGKCAVFPASAFGRSVRNDRGQYQPDLESRQPFGLVEPLLWLASRYEELRTADLEARWGSTTLSYVRPSACRRVMRECSELLETVSRKSGVASRLNQLRKAAAAAAVVGVVSWSVVSASIADSTYYAWRISMWNRYKSISSDPGAPEVDLKSARDFFARFDEAIWPGLLSFVPALKMSGAAKAAEIDELRLSKAKQRLDEANATGDLDRIEPAATYYLEEFPGGPLAQVCRQKLEEIRIERARAALDSFITSRSAGVESIPSLVELRAIEKEYNELLSRAPLECLEAERWQFEERLSRRKEMLAEFSRNDELRKGVESALARDDYLNAAAVLSGHTVKDGFWEGSVRAYVTTLQQRVEARLIELVREENFDSANNAIADAVKGLRDIETTVPPDRRETRLAIVKAYPGLATVRRTAVDEPYDRYLYRAVVESKNKANCDAYVNRAPLGGMKSFVQDYREYLDEIDQAADIKVTPWIEWGRIAADSSPSFEIKWEMTANGVSVAGIPEMLKSDPVGEREPLQRAVAMRAQGYERGIVISIKFSELDAFTESDQIGEFNGRVTPAEMRAGKKFEVKGKDLISPHTLWFQDLQGYRAEPQLPPWRS